MNPKVKLVLLSLLFAPLTIFSISSFQLIQTSVFELRFFGATYDSSISNLFFGVAFSFFLFWLWKKLIRKVKLAGEGIHLLNIKVKLALLYILILSYAIFSVFIFVVTIEGIIWLLNPEYQFLLPVQLLFNIVYALGMIWLWKKLIPYTKKVRAEVKKLH